VHESPEAPYIEECELLLRGAAAQSVLLVASDLFVEVRDADARAPGPAALTPLLAHPPGDEPLVVDLGAGLTLYAQRIDDATATLAVVFDASTSIGLVRLRMRHCIPTFEQLLASLHHPQRGVRPRGGGAGPTGAPADAWLSIALRRRPPD
jgi:hypothetical protein